MKTLSIVLVLIIYACSSKAQDTIKKWNYSIGITFTGVPVVQISGTDTTFQNSLSVAPAFSIRNHSGIGIIYSPAFVTGGSDGGIYMHKITAGFEQYDKKKFDIVAEYTHFFFTNNTAIPYTPISNEIELGATYKKSVIRPKLYTDIGFGTDKSISSSTTAYDIAIAAGFSHSFDWETGGVNLNATPSLMLNAGTNAYFSFLGISKYISHSNKFNNIVKNYHSKNNRGNGNNQTTSTVTTQQLSINYLELNLETSLESGSFSLRPGGSLFFPTSSGLSVDGYWDLTLTYEF
ncbi:hypothetical protein FW778_09500 [Ginsengibacter hankyongi]|uniref:MetA-pathway of phenol degradation n=1 Tax=Ginsengibacter hankyongi TaxID=2607284 RepID=A0A5J5IFX8_9BACT|nr:hypothetical protein [Ginsengibacter hankyongi]KAA9039065.1 hypothetical protein FW778_09500 [Ginsengibacter hankyongi]